MAGEGRKALEDELGARPPRAVAGLPDESLADLAAALRDARRRQREEFRRAQERALRQLPVFVRGPVKKVLFGR